MVSKSFFSLLAIAAALLAVFVDPAQASSSSEAKWDPKGKPPPRPASPPRRPPPRFGPNHPRYPLPPPPGGRGRGQGH
ncbi:hypothetical protein DFJ73DRAFT_957156 [Zopfochytrium polystomum]|nr:hypothetical protein DFJ73DRAFT_957156 [Zopfochytrium polystomum]